MNRLHDDSLQELVQHIREAGAQTAVFLRSVRVAYLEGGAPLYCPLRADQHAA